MGAQIIIDDPVIIYEHGLPYGIRDRTGYLFFFRAPRHFVAQDERYHEDCERQRRLANYLLAALTNIGEIR